MEQLCQLSLVLNIGVLGLLSDRELMCMKGCLLFPPGVACLTFQLFSGPSASNSSDGSVPLTIAFEIVDKEDTFSSFIRPCGTLL